MGELEDVSSEEGSESEENWESASTEEEEEVEVEEVNPEDEDVDQSDDADQSGDTEQSKSDEKEEAVGTPCGPKCCEHTTLFFSLTDPSRIPEMQFFNVMRQMIPPESRWTQMAIWDIIQNRNLIRNRRDSDSLAEDFKHQEARYELGLGRPRSRTYAIGETRETRRPFKGWLKVGCRSFKVVLCFFILCCVLPSTVEAATEQVTHTDMWIGLMLMTLAIFGLNDDSEDSDFWAGESQISEG